MENQGRRMHVGKGEEERRPAACRIEVKEEGRGFRNGRRRRGRK